MANSDSDWLQDLPKTVRQRFDGLANYVLAILDEERLREKLDRDAIQQIQIVVLTRALDQFLLAGTAAAARAVDTFENLGVRSFTIGTEVFEGRNTAVTRGARLSEGLRDAVGATQLRDELRSEEPIREQVLRLAGEMIERRLG